MGDESEWKKLPTAEKIQHSQWKARQEGYEEATKLFLSQTDAKSPKFSEYLGLLKKMATDSNAIAQEKAMDAVYAFVDRAHAASRTAGEVCAALVTKGLSATRQKTKEKSMEILLMYIEIEKQEIVQEELTKGMQAKQPKVVIGSIQTMREALRQFGSKIILVKPLVKDFPRLMDDRDKIVREETKLMVIEIYRWIGPALKSQLGSLKPLQVTELEAEFEKVGGARAVPERYLRSQQEKAAAAAAQAMQNGGVGDATDGPAVAAVPVDEGLSPFDLADAVDILSKLPKDFYEKLEAKKWQERREALEIADKLSDTIKLEAGDYADLMRALLRVIAKDTNVMLVTLAAKITSQIAKGLRKKYSPFAAQTIKIVLDKFKEKKANVVAALRDAADSSFVSTNLEVISEDCLAALENKNPSIRTETTLFLARCFKSSTMATLNKKLLKLYTVPIVKLVNDTVPEVREASFEALGTAMCVVTERNIGPFICDIEALKLTKIKEKAAAVAADRNVAPPAAAAAPAARPATAPAAGPVKSTVSAAVSKAATSASSRPTTAGAKKKPAVRGGGGGGGAKKAADKKKGGSGAAPKAVETALSDDAVEDKGNELLGEAVMKQLADVAWKERLAAMEVVAKKAKMEVGSDIPCQLLVRVVTRKPGLKDNNFQVMKVKLEFIDWLAKNGVFSETSAFAVLDDIFDKVGDLKNGEVAKLALTSVAEACSLEFVGMQLVQAVFKLKNPKNQAEGLNWLSQAILEFGLKMNPKELVKFTRTGFQATNPTVRTAAIGLFARLYMYMGEGLRALVSDEKPALLALINTEIDKVKDVKPPAPVRGLRAAEQNGAQTPDEPSEAADEEDVAAAEDLLPRVDISDLITDDLIALLVNKNWKMRNEGLQKVQEMFGDGKPVEGHLQELTGTLAKMCGDSNKNLVKIVLGLCEVLPKSLGRRQAKTHVRPIVPGVLSCFGDMKPHIRVAAVAALDSWLAVIPLPSLVEGEIFSDALKSDSPILRAELFGWLAAKLHPKPEEGQPAAKPMKMPPEFRDCVPILLLCLEDRSGDVRKKAMEALLPFMIVLGFEPIAKACNQLPAASKDKIRQIVDKVRETLPRPAPAAAPPPPPAAAAPKTISGGRPRTAAAAPEGEEPSSESSSASAPSASSSARPKTAPGGSRRGSSQPATSKKKKEEEPSLPPLVVNENKTQRFRDEQKRKLLKWEFTGPSKEHQAQLATVVEGNCSPELIMQMFHSDFKFHIKAIEAMNKQLTEDENGFAACKAQLDLILKWFTLRFQDTNPSVLIRGLEFLNRLFQRLGEEDYSLPEMEAYSFLPYLIGKVGDPKDNIRRDVRSLLRHTRRLYPASKIFSYIMEGTKVKVAKQRQECLDELGSLMDAFGVNVCQPSVPVALKAIAQQIADRDSGVRTAALNTLVVAHGMLGEGLVKMVKPVITDKESSMLDERIKRAAKAAAAAVSAAAAAGGGRSEVDGGGGNRGEGVESVRGGRRAEAEGSRSEQAGGRREEGPRVRASGEFQLEMQEEGESVRFDMPKLIAWETDFKDLLQPVDRPSTRTRAQSPSTYMLRGSADTNSAITMVASQIASSDIHTSIQALAQIDGVLQVPEKRALLTEHIDQVLMMITTQLRMASGKHLESNNDNSETSVTKLLSCVLATLHSIFSSGPLGREVSRERLKEVVFYLLSLMLDERVVEMSEGPQVIRSVNVMCVRILENANKTRALCSLLVLLRETVSNGVPSKMQQLVMKCLWRITRHLASCIEEYRIEAVLLECHVFLKAYPSSYWQELKQKMGTSESGSGSSAFADTPLRTVKTVLHTLCTVLGQGILKHVASVSNRWESEMEAYVHKTLRSAAAKEGGTSLASPSAFSKKESRTRMSTQMTHERLTEIFRKVGSKELTREGLNDLYDFKQEFPEADLTPYLSKTSQFFQRYIEQGLKNISQERERSDKERQEKQARVAAAVGRNVLSTKNGGDRPGSEVVNPQIFLERLRAVRKNLGMEPNATLSGDAGDTGGTAEPIESAADVTLQSSFKVAQVKTEEPERKSSLSPSELLELKRRLDKIKSSQK